MINANPGQPQKLKSQHLSKAKPVNQDKRVQGLPFAVKIFNTVKDTVFEFLDDDGPTIAGAVAYSALQGVISLILAFIAIGSFLLQDESTRLNFIYGITASVPAELNNANILNLTAIIDTFTKNSGAVSFISIVALLWSGSGVFGQLKFAINKAFDVQKDQRNIVIQFGMQLVLLVVMAVLIIVGFSISIVSSLVLNLKIYMFGISPYNFSFLLPVVSFVLPPLLEWIIFIILFRFTPARAGIRWLPVLIAAAITVVIFELLKILFGLYLNIFGITSSTTRTFGAIGGIFIFLFFLYLTATIILLGAELAAVMHNFKSGLAATKAKEAVVETKAQEINGEMVPQHAAEALKAAQGQSQTTDAGRAGSKLKEEAMAAPSSARLEHRRITNNPLTTIVAGIVLLVATVLNYLLLLRRHKSKIEG
jgi:membrane protein